RRTGRPFVCGPRATTARISAGAMARNFAGGKRDVIGNRSARDRPLLRRGGGHGPGHRHGLNPDPHGGRASPGVERTGGEQMIYPRYPAAEWVPWQRTDPIGNITYWAGENQPAAVVLHIMAGYAATARAWAEAGHNGASWHFTIDREGQVMQHRPFGCGLARRHLAGTGHER